MRRVLSTIFISFIYGEMLTPEDGSLINYTHVFFQWEQVPDAHLYEIEISEDSDFNTVIYTTQDSSLGYIDKFNIELDINQSSIPHENDIKSIVDYEKITKFGIILDF